MSKSFSLTEGNCAIRFRMDFPLIFGDVGHLLRNFCALGVLGSAVVADAAQVCAAAARPIQVCVTGSFSVGKSTFVRNIYFALLKHFPIEDVIMIPEVMTTYYSDERDERETPQTPIKVSKKSVELGEEARKKNPAFIISDRGPMSTWCYRFYFQKEKPLTQEQNEAFKAAQEEILTNYDLILFLRPDGVPVVDDGYRNTNEDVRCGVDEKHAQIISMMQLRHKDRMPPVIELSFSELCKAGDRVDFDPKRQVLICCDGKEIPFCRKPFFSIDSGLHKP